jgi:hypothetical protein
MISVPLTLATVKQDSVYIPLLSVMMDVHVQTMLVMKVLVSVLSLKYSATIMMPAHKTIAFLNLVVIFQR